MRIWRVLLAAFGVAAIAMAPSGSGAQELAHDQATGNLEVVATFNGPMPTGVAVANDGRIFVCFPRWGDEKRFPSFFTVGEVKNGRTVPYPSAAINKADPTHPAHTLLSVQAVVLDPTGKRLWIVDTGTGFGPLREGGPKLVVVDLATNEVVRTIPIPLSVAVPSTYLNDIRFDLRRGREGMAFMTDSRTPGLIVVDIASGKSWRRLQHDPSTQPDPNYLAVFEGRVIYRDGKRFQIGSDGIAISPDGKWLYYSPLTSRHLYRVSVDALANPHNDDAEIAKTIQDLGDKGGAADGLEADAQGRIYVSDFEHNSIHRRNMDGTYTTLVHDARLLWPDTMALASNGYMYVTANQIGRMARFQGRDMRQRPYVLFRFKVDVKRISH